MNRKTILILTASFGAGHKSVAKAIKNYLEDEKDKNYEIVIEDFIEASQPILNNPMVKIYEYQTKYTPFIYNIYYYTRKIFSSKYDQSYKIYTKKLKEYIDKVNPNLIVSTFPQASACIDNMKKTKDMNIPFITVITDVVDSNEWLYEYTDKYCVADNSIKEKLLNKNVPEDKIMVTGVPVDKGFIKENNKLIVPDKYKILIMGGGRGLFDTSNDFFYWLDDFTKDYKDEIEIGLITGTNKELFNLFTVEKPLQNIKVNGYVNNMPELIQDYNLLISKAGGVTLFEAINSEIPIIVKSPNIGQEIENAKFINKKDIGIVYKKELDLKNLITSIVNDKKSFDNKYKRALKSMEKLKKNIYSFEIVDYIKEVV